MNKQDYLYRIRLVFTPSGAKGFGDDDYGIITKARVRSVDID